MLPYTFSFYACCLFPFPAALPVDGAKPGLSFATYLPRCHFLIPSFSPFPLPSFFPLPLLRQGDFLCRFLTLWQQACVFLPRPLCPCLVTRLALPFLYFLLFFAESCCPLPAYRPARARGILAACPCPAFSAFHTSCPVCGGLPSLPPLSYFSIFLCGLAVSVLCGTILARFPCCRAALWQQGSSAFCLSALPSGRLTAPCRPSPFPL